jgi:SAM-dependent methyltransferase
MTFADAKQRFSSRVADYARYRPSYPAAVVDVLRTECGLRPDHAVADIGSGTGLLSELFLKNGNPVFGVEPNLEMRQGGEEHLPSHARFTSVNGSAEATSLPDASVDFVTAGQAFHWFEPAAARREFTRILRPLGWVVAVWNLRERESPFNRAYEDILVKYGTDYARVREAGAGSLRSFFLDCPFSERRLPNGLLVGWEELAGLLRSASYIPGEGHGNFVAMMNSLHELFLSHQENGRVLMKHETHIYFGQLGGSATNT